MKGYLYKYKYDISTYLNHGKYLKRIKKRIINLLKERLK